MDLSTDQAIGGIVSGEGIGQRVTGGVEVSGAREAEIFSVIWKYV